MSLVQRFKTRKFIVNWLINYIAKDTIVDFQITIAGPYWTWTHHHFRFQVTSRQNTKSALPVVLLYDLKIFYNDINNNNNKNRTTNYHSSTSPYKRLNINLKYWFRGNLINSYLNFHLNQYLLKKNVLNSLSDRARNNAPNLTNSTKMSHTFTWKH